MFVSNTLSKLYESSSNNSTNKDMAFQSDLDWQVQSDATQVQQQHPSHIYRDAFKVLQQRDACQVSQQPQEIHMAHQCTSSQPGSINLQHSQECSDQVNYDAAPSCYQPMLSHPDFPQQQPCKYKGFDEAELSDEFDGMTLEKRKKSPFTVSSRDGMNVLHRRCAADEENVPAVQALMTQAGGSADKLDVRSKCGNTALTLAADRQHVNIASTLLQGGASLKATDFQGNTALHVASYHGCFQVLYTLLSVVLKVTKSVSKEEVKKLLEMRNDEGFTCFHLAGWAGNASVMNLLKKFDVDVNFGDGTSGRNVLHHAALAGNLPLVQFMVNNMKADVNARDFSGHTALGLVDKNKNVDVAVFLIQNGGEVRDM